MELGSQILSILVEEATILADMYIPGLSREIIDDIFFYLGDIAPRHAKIPHDVAFTQTVGRPRDVGKRGDKNKF